MEIYQVKSGDSLSAIARDVLGDIERWPDIARLNNLAKPYTIYPGMQLIMPDTAVLGPVVVPKIDRRGEPAPLPAQAPLAAGFDIPQEWIWYGVGALVLIALMNPRRG